MPAMLLIVYPPKDSKQMRYRLRTIALMLSVIWGTACSTVRSKAEMTGVYELGSRRGSIILEVFPNETFTETIHFESRKNEILRGKWGWRPGRIWFDPLWIPGEFVSSYYRKVDLEAGDDVKYTDPGYWSVSATKYWGTITLEFFEEDDEGKSVDFKMIRH